MPEDREVLKAVFQSTPECPSLDELLNADAPAKGETECPHCAGEVALYEQFIAEVPAGELDENILRRLNDSLPTAVTPRWKRWLESLRQPAVYGPAIVAFAGLLAMVGLNLQREQPAGLVIETVERGLSLELLAPKGEIGSAPSVLSWKNLPAAFSYRVKLMEVDRNVIWATEVKATSVLLPSAIQQKALPGKRLIWSVEALDQKGEPLGMGTQDFRRAVGSK